MENPESDSSAGSFVFYSIYDKGNLPGNFDSARSANTIKDRRRSRNSKVAADKPSIINRPISPGEGNSFN